MEDVILIIGPTGSGKSTIARNISELSGGKLSEVLSFTTRPMRPGEDVHPTHIYIKPDDVKKFHGRMAAYTKIGEYEYFTTWDELRKHPVYVIDPRGEKDLRRNVEETGEPIRLHTFYVHVPDEERMGRVFRRDKDPETTRRRIAAEDEQFMEFERSLPERPDVIVLENSSGMALRCAEQVMKTLGM